MAYLKILIDTLCFVIFRSKVSPLKNQNWFDISQSVWGLTKLYCDLGK